MTTLSLYSRKMFCVLNFCVLCPKHANSPPPAWQCSCSSLSGMVQTTHGCGDGGCGSCRSCVLDKHNNATNLKKNRSKHISTPTPSYQNGMQHVFTKLPTPTPDSQQWPTLEVPATHLVTMDKWGATKLAPMKSARFLCLVLDRTDTCSLNFMISWIVASGKWKYLIATSPCQLPLKTWLTRLPPMNSTRGTLLKGMLNSSTTLFLHYWREGEKRRRWRHHKNTILVMDHFHF